MRTADANVSEFYLFHAGACGAAVTASVFEVSATAFQAPSLCFFLYTQTVSTEVIEMVNEVNNRILGLKANSSEAVH